MIFTEHIIGLSSAEYGKYAYNKVVIAEQVKARYLAILAEGVLRPRGNIQRDLVEPGSQYDLDVLAGDGRYVFLSVGPRYRETRPPELCYGFVFDAARLIREGALIGPDMLSEYERILDEVAEEISAELPPAEPLSAKELAEFSETFEIDDADFLAQIAASRHDDNFWSIANGIKFQEYCKPGVLRATWSYVYRAARARYKMRVKGQKAMDFLSKDHNYTPELLWEGELPLSYAVGTIECGQIDLLS